ncbi:potassium channel family protein [Arthrobacter sp. zg-Y411]|uniref:potassium channel family protein n=1 Tax=Arthrobacter zhangbolii TaxID=2886936 RepID=UPI001D133D83|nr:potassium channel family protein [Arthrobacter zhangbolii]MCC3295567.1 potassium channel family protein [Arthrobacter zhangbolii]
MTLETWRRRTELPLAAAAILFLVVYSVQVIAQPERTLDQMLEVLTWTIWAVFLIDYVVNLWLAPQRGPWFVRNLHELLIVVLPTLRPLRLLRLITLLRALNRAGGNALRGRILMYVLASAAVLSYAAALAVLDIERADPEANITTLGDALWWAMTTITTVGYGDHYPVTDTGRLIAAALMIGGIAVLGVVTASLASWLVESVAAETAAEVEVADESIRRELAEVRAQLQVLTKALQHQKG